MSLVLNCPLDREVYDPQAPREFADLAPEEGTAQALILLRQWRGWF
jgi:hypothetical protein